MDDGDGKVIIKGLMVCCHVCLAGDPETPVPAIACCKIPGGGWANVCWNCYEILNCQMGVDFGYRFALKPPHC